MVSKGAFRALGRLPSSMSLTLGQCVPSTEHDERLMFALKGCEVNERGGRGMGREERQVVFLRTVSGS